MIVLPLDTPESVHQRLYRLRSTVIRYGSDIQAAKEECFRLQELYGLVYVPADDDALVIAGHGTIGPEILKQADVSRLEAIICPVTCEALIAGIGMYVKRVAPHVKIIGVERTEDDKLSRSLRLRGKTQSKDQIGSSRFKDETINIFAEVVDDIVLVDDQAISGATKEAFEDTKHILQPTGAMSIAGIKEWVKSNELVGSAVDIVAIASEANVDFSTIPSIIKQAAILEKAIVASALNS
jgi:threonine dehydratase